MITVNEERLKGLMDFYCRVALRTDVACEVKQASESTFFALKELLTAREEIARLKQEIAEDAKATAESQEITGKYMADAESAQRLIRQMVEMVSKGYGNFSGWLKAAEKYLEGK